MNIKNKTIFSLLLITLRTYSTIAQGFDIYSDFPAGNIAIEKIKNDTIYLHPDLRDTKGDWFYWCFAVEKAKGRTLTFAFTKPNVITTMGPAVSYDGGSTWSYMGGDKVHNEAFTYKFDTNSQVQFSMGMPYTKVHFDKFIGPYLESGNVKLDTLAITTKGNVIERLILKAEDSPAKYKILITARHHACEMMADYVMEGIIMEAISNKWLSSNVEFCFIPFVDKDGVENGDQGKNRVPRDHNRDYSGTSIYASTNALRNWVPEWSGKKMVIALDLHCPWIKGKHNENIYLVGSKDEKIAEEEKKFCNLLKASNTGELKVSDKIYLPFGVDWNSSGNYAEGLSFSKWAATIEGVKLPASIEFPYSNNEGQMITQENARLFGIDVANAIENYLKQP